MAAPRYLNLITGRNKQVAAITASAGAADAEKIVATAAATGVLADSIMGAAETGASKVVKTKADGTLDPSIMPPGIGADTATMVTSENLSAGNLVNVYDVAGVPTARKADATAEGKEAHGFVLSATTSPAAALVYFEGRNTQVTGLTAGVRQYLSTTPGGMTTTPPATAGNVVQYVGIGYTATALNFEADDAVTVA